MSQNYSSYQSESGDATHIYTSVLVDGSGTCNPTPDCPCGSATHTPKAYNKLSSAGGWGSGSPQCVSCYLSYQNNQSIAATAGTDYVFQATGEVVCSIFGVYFFLQFPGVHVSIANTKEETTTPGLNTWCPSTPICANTTNPRCKVSSIYEGSNQPCHAAHWCEFIATSSSGTAPYSCYLLNCPDAIDTTPGLCTPQ